MSKKLTDAQIGAQAKALGVEAAALKAVHEVECRGSGFNYDDTPVILFERHVMRYHWKSLGYKSLQAFVNAMYKDEASQLDAMCRYIKVNGLKNKGWKAFARGYNGLAFAKNNYDVKLANAYKKWAAK